MTCSLFVDFIPERCWGKQPSPQARYETARARMARQREEGTGVGSGRGQWGAGGKDESGRRLFTLRTLQ